MLKLLEVIGDVQSGNQPKLHLFRDFEHAQAYLSLDDEQRRELEESGFVEDDYNVEWCVIHGEIETIDHQQE